MLTGFTDLETGRHVPEMLMATISNLEPRLFSMSDATAWDMPGNEREYNRFPQRQVLYQLKVKKVELYRSLNTSSLVRRQPEWQVLDGMWVYGKKYNAVASPPCQPTVRYVIKGRPMDPRIYDAHADTVRQSTVEAKIAITATYRLFFRLIDLTQAFQSTPVKPGSNRCSRPVYARQMHGFEEVPKGAPEDRLRGRLGGITCSSSMFPSKAPSMARLVWASTCRRFLPRRPI